MIALVRIVSEIAEPSLLLLCYAITMTMWVGFDSLSVSDATFRSLDAISWLHGGGAPRP